MPVEIETLDEGRTVEVIAMGRLTEEDYEKWVPLVGERIEKYDTINVIFVMRDFSGYEMWALWEDIKFQCEHFSDIDRLAMVGEESWEEWMAKFCKPFTRSAVKYFPAEEHDKARTWVLGEKERA